MLYEFCEFPSLRSLSSLGGIDAHIKKVLQILLFCVPFYEFLERVGQRSRHSFKDVTPLLDAL